MSNMKELQPYEEAYQRLGSQRQVEAEWHRVMRDEAMRSFLGKGFPTTRDESWKYTDLSAIAGARFIMEPTTSRVVFDGTEVPKNSMDAYFMFFANGWFRAELSDLPEGIRGMILSEIRSGDRFRTTLDELNVFTKDSLEDLNFALGMDGIFIDVPPGVCLEKPIYIVHRSDCHEGLCQPKTIMRLGKNAQAVLIEDFRGVDGKMCFTNSFTGVVLEEGASLEHYKLQHESRGSFHIATFKAVQKEKSVLNSISFALGAKLARQTAMITLNGQRSECNLSGLVLGAEHQTLDHVTRVVHAVPDCKSDQRFKGILGGHSRGVFTGRVLVQRDAQKTDARQTNRNLLLSETARADSRPQLEILADDVKCTHGATVGQLDEDAIFYLRSRGIGQKTARRILASGFAQEIVDSIRHEKFRIFINDMTQKRFLDLEATA